MDLHISWHKPISLVDGDAENLIFTAPVYEWDGVPGVYMFARIFDETVYPLYIGKSEDLGQRARQHFKSSTKLMKGIKKAAMGARVFIPGEFKPKPGQNTKKCILLIEKALINHALTQGYELLNVQGTRVPAHHVYFSGNLRARNVTGKVLSFEVFRDKG